MCCGGLIGSIYSKALPFFPPHFDRRPRAPQRLALASCHRSSQPVATPGELPRARAPCGATCGAAGADKRINKAVENDEAMALLTNAGTRAAAPHLPPRQSRGRLVRTIARPGGRDGPLVRKHRVWRERLRGAWRGRAGSLARIAGFGSRDNGEAYQSRCDNVQITRDFSPKTCHRLRQGRRDQVPQRCCLRSTFRGRAWDTL